MSKKPAINLALLGWDKDYEAVFASMCEEGWVPARVVSEGKHAYIVVAADGEMTAAIAGRLMHGLRSKADLPKVGDWIAMAVQTGENKGVIQSVLPRRTRLIRKLPGRVVEEQIVAVNVDTTFIVLAMDQSFNRRRLERFLVMVHESGAQPVLVLNKMDLCPSGDDRLVEARSAARDIPVVEACALTGKGIKAMKQYVASGKTAAFIGPSGVGKSSLVNRLYGDEIQSTIEVRESDAKGRHATTSRELIQLPWGGLVIDTPGIRELHTWGEDEGLLNAFPDIEALSVGCHFRNCSHTTEKRCAVRSAAESGQLSMERLNNYIKLQKEQQTATSDRRHHSRLTQKRSFKVKRNEMEDQWHRPERET